MNSSAGMRIAVTGLGIWSPAGRDPSQFLDRLTCGPSAIGPIRGFDAEGFRMQVAAEILDFDPYEDFSPSQTVEVDRATQIAVATARAAWRDSDLTGNGIEPARIAVSTGASGAGQYQNTRFTLSKQNVFSKEAGLYSLRNLPHFQTAWLAHVLGASGPSVTFSCASAGSGIAIGYAMQLLRAGRCDVVVAGGSEMMTITSAAGLDSLNLCGAHSCSPFSGTPGMTLGEGAAFFVMESFEHAIKRGAKIRAELASWANRSDGYDSVGTDPSGNGLARTIAEALTSAGLESGQIGWIRASGTSNRGQDTAETLAIHSVFKNPPPVSSFESCVGHANGAAPALGLAGAILCRNAGYIAPTLNFQQPRAGCDLDYVPNQPRKQSVDYVLSQSIAFGGANVALIVGDPSNERTLPARQFSKAAITGIGIVSAAGCTVQTFRESLLNWRSGIANLDRWEGTVQSRRAGLVLESGLEPKNSYRLDALQRFAVQAAEQAISNAEFQQLPDGDRLGAVVALARGSAQAGDQFTQAICSSSRPPAAGKLILRMGRFHVASTLAHRCGLRGVGITISEGITAGLHALVHGRELITQDQSHDAIVVVAADELGPTNTRMFEEMGWLSLSDNPFRAYDSESSGMVLGEGAVALVLERLENAQERGATIYATIDGAAITNDRQGHLTCCPSGWELRQAIQFALQQAEIPAADVDSLMGHGRGLEEYDQRELRAFAGALNGRDVALCCVNELTGVAESASGLFSIAAGALALFHRESYPISALGTGKRNAPENVLIAGSTESGANAAVVLARERLQNV